MKAKLIKTQEGYILEDTNKNPIGQTFGKFQGKKLSLKNCEAIANGYDLDELAIEYFKQIHMGFGILEAYKKGFQKALELNNTKHYTLEDMMNCWNKALTFQEHKELFGYHIQSLQKNEWDVEVVEECLDKNCDGINRKGECITTGKPKHDTDGCLILKRVK